MQDFYMADDIGFGEDKAVVILACFRQYDLASGIQNPR